MLANRGLTRLQLAAASADHVALRQVDLTCIRKRLAAHRVLTGLFLNASRKGEASVHGSQAVFAMPFFQLYYAVGLFDTVWAVAIAHCLFNVPLAVWILEGFVSGVPREIDETAAIDGYSFPRFFVRIFMPLIANGIGVTAFFCFMFSWVEQLLATTLTSTHALPFAAVMTRAYSVSGMDWSLLAAAGVLTMIPGAVVIWFVRNHIAKGFALGRV